MASCLRIVSSNSSRQVSAFSSLKLKWGTRYVHQAKQLPYPVEGGLGKFLPPDALKTLVEYQDGLLERLNNELRSMYLHF
jgi:Fe-Mn family superoxide dismutase